MVSKSSTMRTWPLDIEYPDSYVFELDMPGMKTGDIKVRVEKTLVITGERRRDEEKEFKYLKKGRRFELDWGKFKLPENANTEAMNAVAHDGVLTVTVEKLPPPVMEKTWRS